MEYDFSNVGRLRLKVEIFPSARVQKKKNTSWSYSSLKVARFQCEYHEFKLSILSMRTWKNLDPQTQ